MHHDDGDRDRDYELVLARLNDSRDPLSMDDLCASTGFALHRMNAVLCRLLLAGMTAPVRLRKKGKLVTHYALKEIKDRT